MLTPLARTRLVVASFVLILTFGVLGGAGATPVADSAQPHPVGGKVIPNRYIVTLADDVSARSVARRHAVTPAVTYEHGFHGFAAELSPGAVHRLRADRSVVSVTQDRIVTAQDLCPTNLTTPGPLAAACVPSGIERIDDEVNTTANIDGVDDALDVDIAIIDTGIQPNHPDLRVAGGARFLGSYCTGTGYADDHGHGTHVGGTVAAIDNNIGVVGVAPGARLWAVKVLDAGGTGSLSCVIAGIDWVTANASTIEVANMSLGGGGVPDPGDDPICQAITQSASAGVVYAVAAGNNASDVGTTSPAYCPDVLTVSAVADFNGAPGGGAPDTCRDDVDDTLADFSNFGPAVEIAAPGVCITSTWMNSSYRSISGTSMATPHVAGAAALHIALYGKPTDGAGAAAVRSQIVADAAPQAGDKGFSGDPDQSPEPMLYVWPLAAHDLRAVRIDTPAPVVQDAQVPVTVTVSNHGLSSDSASVSLIADAGPVGGSPQSVNLSPGASGTAAFTWDTSGLSPGLYTLTATIDQVPGETDVTNNSASASPTVRVPEHDVAIDQISSPSAVADGTVPILVTTSNPGTYPETFTVSVSTTAGTVSGPQPITLSAEASATLTFNWTTGSALGPQTITATASTVAGETDTSDNQMSQPVTVNRNMLTVNSTADPGTGVCDETECTLREALTEANTSIGLNNVYFNIPPAADPGCNPATGACTIAPGTALPTATDPINIDGYTQPGAAVNTNSTGLGLNTVLKIELSGINVGTPIEIAGGSSSIRGLVLNRGFGLNLTGEGGNVVEGNFIGTDPTGTTARSNQHGIHVQSQNNRIGGTVPAARNLLSGNTIHGLFVFGPNATGNVVQGNLIGTTADGASALGNQSGINIGAYAHANTIGGTVAGARNVISGSLGPGNGGPGVYASIATSGTVVQGNYIGTDASGNLPIGNAGPGVWMNLGAASSTIGGSAVAANRIAFNHTGVLVSGAWLNLYSSASIRGNSIFSNANLGIDLAEGVAWGAVALGVTPNDSGDTDSGPSNYQNFPILSSVSTNFGGTVIQGTLNSSPSSSFTLDFYSSPSCDASGNGEAEVYLGSGFATTDTGGNAAFTVTLTSVTTNGNSITATATDVNGNTSEFSSCTLAVDPDADNDGVSDIDEVACGAPANLSGRPERTDGVFAGVDDDGDNPILQTDGLDNDGDTLIDELNEGVDEPLPPGSSSYDCDGDGFTGANEQFMYSTSSTAGDQDPCGLPQNSGFNPQFSLAWPADIQTATLSQNKSDITDLTTFVVPVRRLDTPANYHPRWDLNADGVINSTDMSLLQNVRPPMFGGPTEFNKTCPWPWSPP